MNWGQTNRCDLNLIQTVFENSDIPEFKAGLLDYREISHILCGFYCYQNIKDETVQKMIYTQATPTPLRNVNFKSGLNNSSLYSKIKSEQKWIYFYVYYLDLCLYLINWPLLEIRR